MQFPLYTVIYNGKGVVLHEKNNLFITPTTSSTYINFRKKQILHLSYLKYFVHSNTDKLNRTQFHIKNISINHDKTLTDSLKKAPGIILSFNGPRNEPILFLNGYGLKHTPLLLDGIPLYVPYDGYADIDRFTTHSISSVEIFRGLVPVFYGPNSFAGVLNLISTTPKQNFELETGCGTQFDRNGSKNSLAGWIRTGFAQKKWSAQLSARVNKTDSFTLPASFSATTDEDGGTRDHSKHQDSILTLGIKITPTDESIVRIHYSGQRGSKDIPVYTGTEASIKRRYWTCPAWDKDSIYLLSAFRILNKYNINIKLWYSRFANTFRSYDDNTYTTQTLPYTFNSYYDDFTMGTIAQFSGKLWKRDFFTLSVQYKFDCHKEHNDTDPEIGIEDAIIHLAAEEILTLKNNLSLTLGTAWTLQLPRKAEEYISLTSSISNFQRFNSSEFDFQMKLTYEFNKINAILFGIERRTRIPSMKDRYSYKMGKAIPNPKLKPEKNNTITVSLSTKISQHITLCPEIFINKSDDYIDSVTVSPGIIQNQNHGSLLFYGGSLQIKSSAIEDRLTILLNYSWIQWHKYSTSPELTGLSHHKITASIKAKPIQQLSIYLDMYSISNSDSASDGTRPVDSYYTVDTGVHWRIFHSTSISCGVKNLFDKLYQTMEGYPMPGRTYFFRINWKY